MSKEIIEKFSYLSFIEHVEKVNRSELCRKKEITSSTDTGTALEKWTKSKNFSEAVDFAKNGWDAGIEQLEPEKNLVIDGGSNFEHQVYGSFVDVGRFMSGNPDSMVNHITEVEAPKEELTIFCSLVYAGFHTSESAMKYCKKLLEITNTLNSKYDLRIMGFFPTHCNRGNIVTFVEIKKPEDRVVLNSIAYSFHPSFFRRLFFKYIESTDLIDSVHGRPMGVDSQRKYVNQYCLENNINKKILLPNLQDDGHDWSVEEVIKTNNL